MGMLQKKRKNFFPLGLRKKEVMPLIWIPNRLARLGNGKWIEAEMK